MTQIILPLIVIFVLTFLSAIIWHFLTKKPDFEKFEINHSTNELIQTLINEIDYTISLG